MSSAVNSTTKGVDILSIPFNDNCNNLKRCESLKRIIYILANHQFIVSNHSIDSPAVQRKKHEILWRRIVEYGHLVSDYHHILQKHLSHSDQAKNITNFHFIHQSCSKIKCDINHCAPFKLLNANNLTASGGPEMNEQFTFYLDLLRSIHVYLKMLQSA